MNSEIKKLHADKDYAGAIERMSKINVTPANSHEFYRWLGVLLEQSGLPRHAEVEFRQSLLENEEAVATRVNLLTLLIKLSDFNEALQQFHKILLFDPYYLKKVDFLKPLMMDANDPKSAFQLLEYLVSKQKKNADAKLVLAECYAYSMYGIERAKEILDELPPRSLKSARGLALVKNLKEAE